MALYMCQVLHIVDFLGHRRMETAHPSIEVLLRPTQSQSDEPSDLRGFLSPTSVYSTWQSQAVTHPIMNRARRCLTSVIEQIPMSERRIPYSEERCELLHILPLPFHREMMDIKLLLKSLFVSDFSNSVASLLSYYEPDRRLTLFYPRSQN